MPASRQGSANLPAVRSTAVRPAIVDYAADYDISKLWRDRDEYGKPTTIARALTEGERATVERRRRELEIGCTPFTSADQDSAIEAMSLMFGGIKSLRHDDDEAAAANLNGLRHILKTFPLWAIEQGCHDIHCGEAVLNGKVLGISWCPNDAEVYQFIKQIVKPYRKALDNVTALLSAPVRLEDQARRA